MGSQGSDTFWISVDPNNPPDWLIDCGGDLKKSFEILDSIS